MGSITIYFNIALIEIRIVVTKICFESTFNVAGSYLIEHGMHNERRERPEEDITLV